MTGLGRSALHRSASLRYLLVAAVLVSPLGCANHHNQVREIEYLPVIDTCDMPRELEKVVMPTYTVEPPDILVIEGIHIVPREPYMLRTLDLLAIQVAGALPDAPIAAAYPIEPGGQVNLGVPYGTVRVAGMSVAESQEAISAHLKQYLKDPVVSVSLMQMAASQQIAGQFLVAPDGTVTLGSYGSVSVVGQTLAEARQSIERHLSQSLDQPKVSVNVFGYNSKVYYVILQGAGLGDGVYRFPVTGNETVLDAIAQINGLEAISSKRIWIARPNRSCAEPQILPVDWVALTEQARTETNYQLMPGDRVFIAEDKLVALDTRIAKLISPLERIMGFSLLGVATATRFSGNVLRGGGNPSSGF